MKELRTWLMSTPRPTRIVVTDADGEKREVAGPGGKGGGNNWTRLSDTLLTMQPSLVELYDAAGVLLRVMRPEDAHAIEPAKVDLPILHTDPETARLTHFANLLYRATEFSIGVAFSKMVELFQLQTERTERLEARLERTETQYHKTVTERIEETLDAAEETLEAAQEKIAQAAQNGAGGGGGIGDDFVRGLMAGAMQPPPPPPKAGKS